MARVYVSAVMNTSLQEAWAFLRDFGALGNYHPFFENSFIEDGKPSDQVGCVRRFSVRDGGGYLREQLLALSDDEHRCRYKILHIDADWKNYVAEMHLLPITEGNRCFGEWWAEFDVPADQEADACERVAGTFRTFFECVNARCADITTTEVGQHLGGGVCDAGPGRLDAAARHGLPWVGSVGALDMINWGPPSTIPARHSGRLLHVHNADVTLMRSNADEMAAAGRRIAQQLNQAAGPVRLVLPLHGLSMLDAPGQPFHDPEADAALFSTLQQDFISTDTHQLIALPLHINDAKFADAISALVRDVVRDVVLD